MIECIVTCDGVHCNASLRQPTHDPSMWNANYEHAASSGSKPTLSRKHQTLDAELDSDRLAGTTRWGSNGGMDRQKEEGPNLGNKGNWWPFVL